MIESAQRYDIKGKAYIETPKKYYFSDLGLRNARINFRQFEQTHSMENVIYNELRMRGYSVDVGVIPIAEKESSKQSRYFFMVAEVILDFFTVLKVFFSFSGLVSEPIADERIFNKSSNSPIFLTRFLLVISRI